MRRLRKLKVNLEIINNKCGQKGPESCLSMYFNSPMFMSGSKLETLKFTASRTEQYF